MAPDANADLIAMPVDRAADVSGLSRFQLRYWQLRDIVRPSIDRTLSERNRVRLYTFPDMVSLLVARELLNRHFSVQHVRRVVEHLHRQGFQTPLAELKFSTVGKEIYFQMPDGTWSGDKRPNQIVIHQTIPLEPIYAQIRQGAKRRPRDRGRVERRRGAHGSKPVFAGTRIPVDTVVRRLEHGFTADQVIEAYPDLTPADIEKARELAVSA